MMHYLIHHKHRRGWHREGETKQELSQLRMLLPEGDRLMPELKTMLALVKGEEDHCFA
jgi:hypothetical protein